MNIPEEGRRFLTEVIDRARPGQVSSSVQDLTAYDLKLRKPGNFPFPFFLLSPFPLFLPTNSFPLSLFSFSPFLLFYEFFSF